MVKTLCLQCREHGFDPGRGTKIAHAVRRGQKILKKAPNAVFKFLLLSLEPRLDAEIGPVTTPLTPSPTAVPPPHTGPVITTQGLTQPFLPRPASSS